MGRGDDMIIESRFFDECWCPTEGIARVCMNGSKGIPKELEDFGREKDGDDYDCSCFSVNVIVENGVPVSAVVSYMAANEMWDYCQCDNYEEAWEFYKEHAPTIDIDETLGKGW